LSYVYLIHFEKPLGNKGRAKHYLGYTRAGIKKRLNQHKNGTGSRICAAAALRGELQLVRLWRNATRQDERQLKRQHNSPRLCPVCNPKLSASRPEQTQCLN
jgi:predicted GIY-YIG superfamily endonuclease